MVPALIDAGSNENRGAQSKRGKGSFKMEGFLIKAMFHPVVQPRVVQFPHWPPKRQDPNTSY